MLNRQAKHSSGSEPHGRPGPQRGGAVTTFYLDLIVESPHRGVKVRMQGRHTCSWASLLVSRFSWVAAASGRLFSLPIFDNRGCHCQHDTETCDKMADTSPPRYSTERENAETRKVEDED